MVHHHPITNRHFSHAGTNLGDDTARLVAGDLQVCRVAPICFGRPVVPQVAAAQAGGFHGDHDFARAGMRVRQGADLYLFISGENYSAHGAHLRNSDAWLCVIR